MAPTSMQENRLTVNPAEFKTALKPFARKGIKLGQVVVAFEGGFLSVGSCDLVCLMRASGTAVPDVPALQILANSTPVRCMTSRANGREHWSPSRTHHPSEVFG